MSEQTIAAPLSGEEVVDVILDRIRQMLKRDCYLNPVAAYEAFSAEISISVRLKDSGREPEVKARVVVASPKPIDDDAFLAQTEDAIGEAPPNAVRREAGLPIPTLVSDSDGRQDVKRVRYARKVEPEI